MDIKKIGVVYLCRANEKKNLFSDFIDSYKKFPANCSHELIIIFKGFQDHSQNYFDEVRALFDGLNFYSIYLFDDGFDIGSYLATAKIVDHDYLLFFNTSTTIVGKGWLGYLCKAINHENVGLVGTSASYEGYHTFLQMNKFSCLYFQGAFGNDPGLVAYYLSLFNYNSLKYFRRLIKFRIRCIFEKIFEKKDIGISEKTSIAFQKGFDELVYNPHIRTNSFMISRELLLDLFGHYCVKTKGDCYEFEHGGASLTRKVLELGKKTFLVDVNGVTYDVEDWGKSNTFRLGEQIGLLTHDNQTRNYDNYSEYKKLLHSWMSWGDVVLSSKVGFFSLICGFISFSLKNLLKNKNV